MVLKSAAKTSEESDPGGKAPKGDSSEEDDEILVEHLQEASNKVSLKPRSEACSQVFWGHLLLKVLYQHSCCKVLVVTLECVSKENEQRCKEKAFLTCPIAPCRKLLSLGVRLQPAMPSSCPSDQ